eukprot:scaffold29681_cov54-Attheya_sp.AAC.2
MMWNVIAPLELEENQPDSDMLMGNVIVNCNDGGGRGSALEGESPVRSHLSEKLDSTRDAKMVNR